MFLYCPGCQNLIEKSTEEYPEGTTLDLTCSRCDKTISYYIKYKPVGKITGSRFDSENAGGV